MTRDEAIKNCPLLYCVNTREHLCYVRVNGEQLEVLYEDYNYDFYWVKLERVNR